MKIKKTEAVALLVALDFPKATTLSTKDLEHRIQQVPEKVDAADVPDAQKDLYDQLVKAKGDVQVVEEGGKDEKTERKSKVDKAVDKMAADKKKADAKKEKDKPEPKGKKEKEGRKPREKKERAEVEKDAYGSVVGSDRAKINAAFPKDWASVEDIAKEADVDLKKTKSRLRRARRQGHLEVRKIVEYRIKPSKK